jgi:ElaB/YqjD/DUF883 family membrane-anchored ribosome-binding protein
MQPMSGNGKHTDIQGRAEDIASEAADSLRDLGRNARGTAEDVKKQAVKLLNTAADTIRKESRQAGAKGEVRDSVDNIASGLEHAAHYLRKHSYEDMSEDMTKSVQRNPWRTVAIIFVVGIIIGMMLRGENTEEYQYDMEYRKQRGPSSRY